MKLQIVGDGAFGTFLKDLLHSYFEIVDNADSVILAVPISAYEPVAYQNLNKHLINVCSVQKPSTDICLRCSNRVTSIHPLFGKRTPPDRRNSILTYSVTGENTWAEGLDFHLEFLKIFEKVSKIHTELNGVKFTPESHDLLMSKTHLAAVIGAKQLKVYTDRVKDVPDELIPNSFRLMRDFVKTLEDMPQGTIESIMANPYFDL